MPSLVPRHATWERGYTMPVLRTSPSVFHGMVLQYVCVKYDGGGGGGGGGGGLVAMYNCKEL